MNTKLAVFLVMCFVYTSTAGFSQETEAETEVEEESAPMERNIFADAGYASLGIIVSNVFLNLNSRLGEQAFANMTYKDIWHNLTHNTWFWEDGDRFLVNQFGHPYQGSTYFASARINGFNFYESMLFVPPGSLMWEVLMEPEPSVNDFITTTVGGIALGEMLHRLFLEVDSPSIGATIGSFLISPLGGLNKIYNRHPRESGGGNIYEAQVRTGVEKTFAFFPGHEKQADSWNYPGGHINVNVVYGDPFVQESKTPYEHFELYAGFTTNTASYHAAIVSDGYLFSFNPVQTDTAFTSTGLSMHFDFFNATNDLIDNLGYGNLQFSSSAVGWTVKHKYCFLQNFYFEMKAHAAVILWGNSMYNGEYINNDYWVPLGDNLGTYGMGENVKLFFTLFHNKAGKLELAALGYHIFSIPVTSHHSTGNAFFIFGSLDYCFPLGKKIGIGTRGTFWGLFGLYDSAENAKRFLVSNTLYLRFSL